MKNISCFLILFFTLFTGVLAQTEMMEITGTDANIFGDVQSEGEHIPFASVFIEGTNIGTTTDETGHYMLIDLPEGPHVIVAKALGYTTQKKDIVLKTDQTLEVNFDLDQKVIWHQLVLSTHTQSKD